MKGTFKKMFLVLAGVLSISAVTQMANAQSISVWSGAESVAKVVDESRLVCLNSTVSWRLSSVLDRDPYCCSQRNDSDMLACLQAHVEKTREYSSFVWGLNREFFRSASPIKNDVDLDLDADGIIDDQELPPTVSTTAAYLHTQIRHEKARLTSVIAYFDNALGELRDQVQRR